MPVRAAVVGLGFGARVHLPGLRTLAGVEVVAVCARRGAEEVARAHGVPRAYDDWRALLEREPLDLLTVAVPPGAQAEVAGAAVDQGLAVLCEKPLGVSAEGARALAERAAAAGVPTLVDFEFRALPAFARARELLAARSLGPVRRVEVEWTLGTRAAGPLPPSWKDEPAQGGGALLSLGVHVFDYLAWLVAPVETVTARLEVDPGRSDTGFAGELELAGAIPAAVHVTTAATEPGGHVVRVVCADGTLELANRDLHDFMRGFSLEGPGVRVAPSGGDEDGRIAPFAALALRIVDAVGGGPAPDPGFEAAAHAHAVAAAVVRSDGKRTTVPL
jgi:predicted dehydrogenase